MPRRLGFTLIEVLVAIALMLALSAGLFSYVWNLISRRDRLVEVAAQQAAAGALFEELERDLATTFAVDASGSAGVKGDSASLAVRCRGVAGVGGRGEPIARLDDLLGGEVKFEEGSLSARRLGDGEGTFEVVTSGVQLLRLRYFDGRAWLESFDSAATGTLPVAVEAALWFGEVPEGENELEAETEVRRAPDRLRVIVVPDGPGGNA